MQDEVFVRESIQYRDLLCEYCSLAVKCVLTEDEADLMDTILQKAENDSLLSLLIDEADHLIAHELKLIDQEFVEQQQTKLQNALDVVRVEQLLLSIQICSQELQAVLQNQGLYVGAIDGVCGPRTQEAANRARQTLNDFIRQLIYPHIWPSCSMS
ncbi:hypothetical protein IQ268_12925 [Oculatella sp. LEGE 06141]|uniref:peptidoglycan-binding domain-containing protein n=1 Tax=Oculatella sp. LEGE 06141 TaxID=1828648 RepID=UPI00188141DF|nr:hypothetical protein [Oculatella sp. LEGE 06141]MBE9179466.1 hypothetical protein [Oculatella sp. LEGE 06141]